MKTSFVPKTHIAVLLAALCLASINSTHAAAQAANVSVPPGTIIPIAVTKKVDASRATVGDVVHLKVEGKISVGGVLIVPDGAPVLGEVVSVTPHGILGARVTFAVDEIQLSNGDSVLLFAQRTGSSTIIPVGTELLARVAAPNGQRPEPASPGMGSAQDAEPAGTPASNVGTKPAMDGKEMDGVAPSNPATPKTREAEPDTRLSISSTPPGATTSLDGKPIGITPLNTVMRKGEHAVTVSSPGYTSFNRQVSATGKTVNIKVVLSPSDADGAMLKALTGGGGQ